MHNTVRFKNFDIILDVMGISEEFISFLNQITWSILVQKISSF